VLVGEGEFFLDYFFVGLGEFGFCFDAEAAGVVEELVDGLVGYFSVEEFAYARLRLGEDDLEFLSRVFFGELQDGLVELGFEFQRGGVLGRKTEIVEDVAVGYMGRLVSCFFHAFSPPPKRALTALSRCFAFSKSFWASRGSFSRSSEERR